MVEMNAEIEKENSRKRKNWTLKMESEYTWNEKRKGTPKVWKESRKYGKGKLKWKTEYRKMKTNAESVKKK